MSGARRAGRACARWAHTCVRHRVPMNRAHVMTPTTTSALRRPVGASSTGVIDSGTGTSACSVDGASAARADPSPTGGARTSGSGAGDDDETTAAALRSHRTTRTAILSATSVGMHRPRLDRRRCARRAASRPPGSISRGTSAEDDNSPKSSDGADITKAWCQSCGRPHFATRRHGPRRLAGPAASHPLFGIIARAYGIIALPIIPIPVVPSVSGVDGSL